MGLRGPKSRRWARWVLCASAGIAFACSSGEDVAQSDRAPSDDARGLLRPNVILITWDTVRADAIGPGRDEDGAPRPSATETFDRFAREGVTFTEARSPVPITLPAHTSMLSGLWPSRHGVRDNGIFEVPSDLPTLATEFEKAGYATGAFVSAAVLDRRYGLARGFQEYDDSVKSRPGQATVGSRNATAAVDAALEWLESVPDQQPILLWLHLFDPHRLWLAPEPWAERFPDPYRAEIAYADAETGRFLDRLAEKGRLQSSVVVMTSDHGEGLGEHGEQTHAYFAYESTLRVPLLFWLGERVPHELERGARVPGPASLVDLAPTLLELAGLPASFSESSGSLDGRSLVGALVGEKIASRMQPIECVAPTYGYGTAPIFGVITENNESWYELPERERYDLHLDPNQLANLYGPDDSLLGDQIFARVDWNWPPEEKLEMDPATRDQLMMLGYLVDGSEDERSMVDPKTRVEVDGLLSVSQGFMTPERALRDVRELEERYGLLPALARYEIRMLDALGRSKDAMVLLQRAVAANPDHETLGEIYAARRQDRQEKVSLVVTIRRALASDPSHPSARRDLALTLHQLQELDEAEELYLNELAADAENLSIRLNLARLMVTRGEYQEGFALLDVARRIPEHDAKLDCDAGRILGWYLERKPEAAKAMAKCEAAGFELNEKDRSLL